MSEHANSRIESTGTGLAAPVWRLIGVLTALALALCSPAAYAGPPSRSPSTRPTRTGTTSPADGSKDTKDTKAGRGTTRGAPKRGGGGGQPELTGDEGGGLPFNTCKRQPRGAKFTITLPREAELDDLVNWMMSVSCQKFIWDPQIRSGKVTVLSPEPVTMEEAYAAFYASIETMGLTVEPSGKYFKIVEKADAKTRNLPVYGPGGRAPDNDRYVTQLYRTRSGNTKELVDLLNKLKSKEGSVETVDDLIIITDKGSSVRRMMRILRQVDTPSARGEKIFFYQLKWADPEEVADIIREIFGEKEAAAKKGRAAKGKAPAEPSFSRVIVDSRTGTLIIVAQQSDYIVIRRLIEQLDVPEAGGGAGRIHVHKLVNADPEEVANVLNQLASGAKSGGGDKGKGGGGRGASQAGQGGGAAELFSGEVKVTADPATRSLVILASFSDYAALKHVILELDQERKQVYIEVYLLELTVTKRFEAGTAAHFGSTFNTGQGQGLGFVASAPDPSKNSLVLDPTILQGIVGGVLGPEVPGSGQFLGLGRDIPAFGVIIQALQSDSDVNIVAEPHVYTADNQEALIEVGRNVPTQGALAFPGGAGGAGGLVPVQSIQRENVTLQLKLTPHINDKDTVTLDVELDNRDIESQDPVLGVTTTQRRLKLDKVVAHDDVPVVLGGLVQEVERITESKVPGLGAIPLIGWLFKRKETERVKQNLLMILVPHIVDSPDDVRRIHERRTKERLEFLERETAFKKRDLPTNVNYRKKSGLLAEIDREARRQTQEDAELRVAESELQGEVITGEIGMSPRRVEPDVAPAPKRPAKPAGVGKPANKPRQK